MENLDPRLEATNTIESHSIVIVLAEDAVPWWQSSPLYSTWKLEHVEEFRSKLAQADRDEPAALYDARLQHSYLPAISLFMADSCLCHRWP